MERDSPTGWRWTNVPLPEPHVVGLAGGALLNRIAHWRLARRGRTARILGIPLLIGGTIIGIWAVRTVDEVDTTDPDALITDGPYAFSRNPMYVAWTSIYAGVSLIVNAAWPIALLPAVATWTHAVVLHEERELEASFGEEYREYEAAVRRYV